MRLFLTKTGFFFLTVLSVFILALLLLTWTNNRALKNYNIPTEISSLFIGDSHVEKAFNDAFLPNSINLAKYGESTYYTFFKLGPILKNNPSIKKVYLGYSYHNISAYSNDNIYGTRSINIAPRYFFILSFAEKLSMIKHNKNKLPAFFRTIITTGVNNMFVKNNDFSFLGGYNNNYNTTTANKKSMDKRLTLQYFEKDANDFSFININYLNKIIALCKKENVELIILNTPLHPYYKSRIPPKFIEKYDDLIIKSNVKQIGFENLKMSDSCFIPDGDHLSVLGALITTKELKKRITLSE